MTIVGSTSDLQYFAPFSADLGSKGMNEDARKRLGAVVPVGAGPLTPNSGVNMGGGPALVLSQGTVPTFDDPHEADVI